MSNLKLKDFHNKTVTITFRDGEIATARLTCNDDDCDSVLVDILGTNCPDRYHEPNACSYTVPCSEIVSVDEMPPSGSESEPVEEIRAAA
jgi:small nuclear ribonucleoprotein (snRNP)-like protein